MRTSGPVAAVVAFVLGFGCSGPLTGPEAGVVPSDAGREGATVLPDAVDDAAPDVAAVDAVTPDDATSGDAAPGDAMMGAIGPRGGTVDRFRFAVFGDVRPPAENDTDHYPTMVFGQVMAGIASLDAQFAIATGDYMFASSGMPDVAARQLDLLLGAEAGFHGHVFHAMGNHECFTTTTSNCPASDESANARAFRARLNADQAAPYYDFTVRTGLGDAHFLVTAPNAWSDAQSAWLDAALAMPARYTFVIAHEPPTSFSVPPGSAPIDTAVRARAGGVTLNLYGHIHYYRHPQPNAIVCGNAGAPLNGTGSTFGFVVIEQRADGDVSVVAYEVGDPPMVRDTFVLHPDGTVASGG